MTRHLASSASLSVRQPVSGQPVRGHADGQQKLHILSTPRTYRRVLCNYLGELVDRGEYFSGEAALKQVIEDVCFNNVNEFFGFHVNEG